VIFKGYNLNNQHLLNTEQTDFSINSLPPSTEFVLIRFNFYSNITGKSHCDISMSRIILDSGVTIIENKCMDLLATHLKFDTLVPHGLTLIDSNPDYAQYNQILSECFDNFQLTFVHKKKIEPIT
jgi:hypothetical protein